jgi:predicted molibdopterin-dependent oxidoreductase YjgC
LADVVLPVAILAERQGTLVGLDGRRNPMNRAFQPPAGLPQDGQLLLELARRMGHQLPAGEALAEEMTRQAGWEDPPGGVRRLFPAPAPTGSEPLAGVQLDAGPQLFHSGSVTAHSRQLQGLSPLMAGRLNPADLQELELHTGDELLVVSAGRELRLKARPDRTVRRGTVVIPWHDAHQGAAGIVNGHGDIVPIELRRSPSADRTDAGRG